MMIMSTAANSVCPINDTSAEPPQFRKECSCGGSTASDDEVSIADSNALENRPVTDIPEPWARQPDGAVALNALKPPCMHNNWNILRVKRGVTVLCCRECFVCWRVRLPILIECTRFRSTRQCVLGCSCPLLHVHKFKKTNISPNARAHRANAERDPVLHRAALDVMSSEANRAAGVLENESLLMELIGARREELVHLASQKLPAGISAIPTKNNDLVNGTNCMRSSKSSSSSSSSSGDSTPRAAIETYQWNPYAIQLVVNPTVNAKQHRPSKQSNRQYNSGA